MFITKKKHKRLMDASEATNRVLKSHTSFLEGQVRAYKDAIKTLGLDVVIGFDKAAYGEAIIHVQATQAVNLEAALHYHEDEREKIFEHLTLTASHRVAEMLSSFIKSEITKRNRGGR